MKSPLLTLLTLLLLPALLLSAELSKDWKNMETLYRQGKLDDLSSTLFTTKTKTDDDRALQTYLSAMLKTGREDTVSLLQQAVDRFPSTYYGQQSMLELAKIRLLEHDPAAAAELLKTIKATDIAERYYWLAVCADAREDHEGVIAQGENYLRLEPKGRYCEDTHYLIASAYQAEGKLQSAATTLGKLQALEGFPQNKQYFHWLLGSLQHKLGLPDEALENYRKGFELNKNSQIAFQIEDSLFDLKSRYGTRVDLSFLYPYAPTDSTTETVAQTNPTWNLPPVDDSLPLKLGTKPQTGYFVQTGRFGVEANAAKMATSLRGLSLPGSYFEDKGNKSTPWVAVAGPYPTKGEADLARSVLSSNGIESFITQF